MIMANYRVVTGPKVTKSGMICGPDVNESGSPFEAIIAEQVKDGYQFVQVFSHEVHGACCFIFPQKIAVTLLVFKKG
jgi:hypothetical protein